MIEETEKLIAMKEEADKSSFPSAITKIDEKAGIQSELQGGKTMGAAESDSQPVKSAYSKHPLEYSWTFWFDNPSAKYKQAAWGCNIRPVHTVSSVEDFWSVYNNVHKPSKLVVGADFHCFKNRIEPKWEDPVCANGGKWTMCFARGKSDSCWLYTLLAMIGEQFDCGGEICGAVVNVRARQEKISIWTKNAANESAQMSIGRQWKEFLEYKDTIGFIFHEDAMKERVPKNRYVV